MVYCEIFDLKECMLLCVILTFGDNIQCKSLMCMCYYNLKLSYGPTIFLNKQLKVLLSRVLGSNLLTGKKGNKVGTSHYK